MNDFVRVDKDFFRCLLKSNLNPMIYVTKSKSNDAKVSSKIINNVIDEQLDTAKSWVTSSEASLLSSAVISNREKAFSSLDSKMKDVLNNHIDDIDNHTKSLFKKGLATGCNQINRHTVWKSADKSALAYSNQYAFGKVKELSNDVTSQIRKTVWDGVQSGKSIPKIQENILSIGVSPLDVNGRRLSPNVRAEMIARTESARLVNTGTLQAYSDYGVEQVVVITADDDDVCEDCLSLSDDNPWSITEASNLLPVHPNCRCCLGAYIPDGETLNKNPVDNPEVMNMTTDDSVPSVRNEDSNSIDVNGYRIGVQPDENLSVNGIGEPIK